MDQGLRDALDKLTQTILRLPRVLTDFMRITTSNTQTALTSFGSRVSSLSLSALTFSVQTFMKHGKDLVTLFANLADTLKKVTFPSFGGGFKGFNLAALKTTFQGWIQAAGKAGFKGFNLAALKTTFQGWTQAAGNFASTVKQSFSSFPASFTNALKSFFAPTTKGKKGKAGSASFLRTASNAFMKIEQTVENLRRQALGAHGANTGLAQFDGKLFTEMMQFNYGQFQRTRTMAHATSESGALLAHRVNQMEDAFLPFDIMKRDIGNKLGIIKANLSRSFAETFLTPLANVYNWLGKIRDVGLSSDSMFLRGATVFGGIAGGAALGALAGARYGPWGAGIGGILGAAAGAFGLDADRASRSLGNSIKPSLWFAGVGALFGLPFGMPLLGAGIGGAVGAGLGMVMTPDEKVKIHDGPWMAFLREAKDEKPLRPPIRHAPVPDRIHRWRP